MILFFWLFVRFVLASHGLLSRLTVYIFPVAAYDTDCAKVGELVCEVAAATNAACVAMARHGKGTLRELVTGSVTNYCVHRCGTFIFIYVWAIRYTDIVFYLQVRVRWWCSTCPRS